MSKISTIFLLGIITAILSGTGFPSEWKTVFYVIIGAFISIISLLVRKEINSLRYALRSKERVITDSFTQNSHIDTYGKENNAVSEGRAKHTIN